MNGYLAYDMTGEEIPFSDKKCTIENVKKGESECEDKSLCF